MPNRNCARPLRRSRKGAATRFHFPGLFVEEPLLAELRETEDPRVVGPDPEVFDSYLRYSPMREFPKPIEGSTLK
jgi:hypothetical protein